MREPLAVGLNCALGARQLRPYVAGARAVADTHVCAYPNAGLPNAFGEYDERPDETAAILREFAPAGLVNIVGGCCGTTPEHIRRMRDAVDAARARVPIPTLPVKCRLVRPRAAQHRRRQSLFVNIGERTNVTGSAQVPQADRGRRLRRRARRGAPAGRERRADHRRQHGRGHARFGERRWRAS